MIKEIRDELLHKANKALREEAVQASKSVRYPVENISCRVFNLTLLHLRLTPTLGYTPIPPPIHTGPPTTGCTNPGYMPWRSTSGFTPYTASRQ
jgi:hypothetical protein